MNLFLSFNWSLLFFLLNSTKVTSPSPLPLCNVYLESGNCQETVHEPENDNESREGRFQILLLAFLPLKTVGG